MVLIIALIVPLLNTLPSVDAYLKQRIPEKVFMGFRYTSNDHYTYASFVEQAADEGRFFMEDRLTTEPQKGRFLLAFMWLAGQIRRVTGLGIPLTWELLRIVTGAALLLAVWWFTGLLFKDASRRMLAYVFVAFGGGVGWLLYLITGGPGRSVTLPFLRDAFNHHWNWSTFGSMIMPLWIAPAAILLFCAGLVVRDLKSATVRTLLLLILPPVIWFIHPYTGIAAYLTFGLFPLVPIASAAWRIEPIPWARFAESLKKILPALLSFTVVALYIRWARQDLVYATTAEHVFTWNPTYSIFLYPFAYGLLLPLALYGLKWGRSLPAHAREIMIAWLTSAVILAVNPFLSGVKFQYLVHLPLAIFAAHGVFELKQRSDWARRMSVGVPAMVFAVLLFLNAPLILIKEMPSTAAHPDIYLSSAEIAGMTSLKDFPPGNVLCSTRAGNRIAWLGAKKVYVGHWFLTPNHDKKQIEAAAFFNPRTPTDQKREWLAQKEIRYVYVGPDERAWGGIDPALGLTTLYDKEGVTVYEVPQNKVDEGVR